MKKSIYDLENKIFCDLLYRLRLKAGFKQSDLAQTMGVPQSFISKIENGQRRIDIIELQKLCAIYNLTLSEFVKQFEKEIHETRKEVSNQKQ